MGTGNTCFVPCSQIFLKQFVLSSPEGNIINIDTLTLELEHKIPPCNFLLLKSTDDLHMTNRCLFLTSGYATDRIEQKRIYSPHDC